MKWFMRFLWMIWVRQTGRRAIHKAKAQGILFYLKALNVTRQTLIVILLATLALHLLLMSCMGLLVTGVLLYKPDTESALQILFYAFAGVVAIFFLAGTILLSQRLWYRMSGAQKLVQDLEKDAA